MMSTLMLIFDIQFLYCRTFTIRTTLHRCTAFSDLLDLRVSVSPVLCLYSGECVKFCLSMHSAMLRLGGLVFFFPVKYFVTDEPSAFLLQMMYT